MPFPETECIKKFLARGKLGLNEMIKLFRFKIGPKLLPKMQTNLRSCILLGSIVDIHDRHRRHNAMSEPEFGRSKVECREF